MSMMRKPEMDVIRFKEADVIVASGGSANSLTLNFGQGGKLHDGYAIINGSKYEMNYTNYDDLKNLLTAAGYDINGKFYHDNTLETILKIEYGYNDHFPNGVKYPNTYNGTYTYDSTTGIYSNKQ